MKKIIAVQILVFLFSYGCAKTSGGNQTTTTPTTTPVDTTAKIPFKDSIFNGVNLQPSYYNSGMPNFAWELMKKQTKIKTVRIEIEPDKAREAKTWISEAKANGFTVIATYHKYTVLGSDKAQDLMDAAIWWRNNYVVLGGNFTINLMNEWGSHNIGASDFAKAYNDALKVVREVYTGPVIIDIPGWGQETFTAYQACKTSTPVISDTSIILSAHIYPNGWNQGRNHGIQAADLDDLTNTGRKCIIGEFGNGISGSADWSAIIDRAKSKGWPVIGWCWNGDGGTMNMVDPSWAAGGATASSFALSNYFTTIYNKL